MGIHSGIASCPRVWSVNVQDAENLVGQVLTAESKLTLVELLIYIRLPVQLGCVCDVHIG